MGKRRIIIQKRKTQSNPQANAAKATTSDLSAWSGAFYGGSKADRLSQTKWGAALAYTLMPEIYSPVTLLADNIDGLVWEQRIVKTDASNIDDGEVIATAKDPVARTKWAKALRKFYIDNNDVDLTYAITRDALVFGAAFILFTQDAPGERGFEYLNPLGMSPVTEHGFLTGWRYSSGYKSVTIPLEHVAYYRLPSIYSDIDGFSPTMNAIGKAGISLNFDEFLRDFFRNNMQSGFIATPGDVGGLQTEANEETTAKIRRTITEQLRGVGNQFKALVLGQPLNITSLDTPDIGKIYQLSNEVISAIYSDFRVPRAMLGNSNDAPYDNADAMVQAFTNGTLKPLAESIEQFINVKLMPWVREIPTGGATIDVFTFNVDALIGITEADVRRNTSIYDMFLNTAIDLATMTKKLGQTPIPEQEGIYMVEGSLVLADEMPTFWKNKLLVAPSTTNAELLVAKDPQALPTDEDLTEDDTTPPDDEPTPDEPPPTQSAPDSKAADALPDHDLAIPQLWRASSIDDPLAYLTSGVNPFAQRHAEIQAQIDAMPDEINGYRDSALTALRDSVDNVTSHARSVIDAGNVEITEWGGFTWKARRKTNKRPFVFKSLPDDVAAILTRESAHVVDNDGITEATAQARAALTAWHDEQVDYVKAVVAADRDRIKDNLQTWFLRLTESVKALQATRIDFEDGVEDLMNSALAGDVNRARWGARMRNLISTAVNKAYRDGLTDGGVESEPDDVEKDWIASWIREQSQFVTALGAQIFKDEVVTEEEAAQKPGMWWNRSVVNAYYEGFASAKANQMMECVGTDGKDSCATCMAVKGQKHRMKTWRRSGLIPQSDGFNYICTGLNCKHHLIETTGRALGSLSGVPRA